MFCVHRAVLNMRDIWGVSYGVSRDNDKFISYFTRVSKYTKKKTIGYCFHRYKNTKQKRQLDGKRTVWSNYILESLPGNHFKWRHINEI